MSSMGGGEGGGGIFSGTAHVISKKERSVYRTRLKDKIKKET